MALEIAWVTSQSAIAGARCHHLAHQVDPAFGIDEGAVLFQEGRARQEDMRVVGRFVQEQVVHHDAFHGRQAGGHVFRVGIGLGDVLALDVQAEEAALDRGIEHVGDAQPGFRVDRDAPLGFRRSPARRAR